MRSKSKAHNQGTAGTPTSTSRWATPTSILRRAAGLLLPAFIMVLPFLPAAGLSFDAKKAIKRAVDAHGGAAAIEKVERHGRRTGSFTQFFPAPNSGTFIEWKKGDKVLIEVQLAGLEVAQGYDGERAWVESFGQVIDAPQQVQTAMEEERRHGLTLLLEAEDEGFTLEAAEPDTAADGSILSGVKVGPADGGPLTSFYFDPKTGLVTKLSYTDTNPYQGGEAYFEGYLDDYEESGGVLYPSRVTHYMDGVQMDEVVYESVDFQLEIADEIFAKPDTREAGLAKGGEPGKTEDTDSLPTEVPFEFSVRLIFLEVWVEDAGDHCSFILDTGAGMTCLSKELAAELEVEALGGMSAAGAGGAFEAHTARLEELRVGDLRVNDLEVMVLDLAPLASMMGKRIDGIVGYNVLNRYTTTIDISGETLTFASSDDELPTGEDHFSVPFEVLMGIPVVKGTVDGVTELDFLVDTGATTSVLPKAAAEGLEPTQRLEGAVAAGADSRPIEMALARFSTLELGGATMDGPVFSYPLSSERVDPIGLSIDASNRGVIGTSILSNFRVTLNYDKATMVLEPVEPPQGTGREWSGPGLTVFMEKGSPSVRSVFKGGPADGLLEVGDRILDIDGASVDGKNLEEIMSMLQGDPGTELKLTIERDGAKKKVTLVRRKLL